MSLRSSDRAGHDEYPVAEDASAHSREESFDVHDIEEGGKDKALSAGDQMKSSGAALLPDVPHDKRVALTWHDLNAFVPTQMFAPSLTQRAKQIRSREERKKSRSKRQILYNCKGAVLPGEVLALMGPSGSGKTSLISCLGSRIADNVTVDGHITFNGKPLTRKMKKHIGYVLQDDMLHESLTVYETLFYAALLRLPKETSRADKVERVEAVISALNIRKCRNTLIGGASRRGVSGGERKRVSVGQELLINPQLLLLDEPTSGLDSTTAMNLLSTLRGLATGGRTVVTTIHQPSSRLYMQLDKLILMADGHVMYSGRAALVHEWFRHFRCELPYGVNVADYILDLANGDFDAATTEQLGVSGHAAKDWLIEKSEQFLEVCEDGYTGAGDLQHVSETQPRRASVEVVEHSAEGPSVQRIPERSIAHIANGGGADFIESRRSGAGYLDQVKILTVRCLKTRRFEALGSQKFLQLLIVAIVASLFWFQRGDTKTIQAGVDIAALLFFEMIFMSFSTLFAALFTFPTEIRMLLKERASDMYQLSAFYFARIASDLPMDCLYPSMFVIIVYFTTGLRLTVGAFLANWFSVLLGVLTAQSIGLFIGAAVGNFKQAQTIATVTILTFMLVGGFWVKNIPSWISWVRYLSFVYWEYSLLIKIQFRNNTYFNCNFTDSNPTNDINVITECPPEDNLQDALALPRDPQETPVIEVAVLFAMLFTFRYAIYLVLRHKTRKV